MPLIAVHTHDPRVAGSVRASLRGSGSVAVPGPSWVGFRRVVVNRPVSISVVDLDAFDDREEAVLELRRFREDFPRQGLVVVARGADDPLALFRLGQARISELVLLRTDAIRAGIRRAVARAGSAGVGAALERALSTSVPRRDLLVLRHAAESLHESLSADAFAATVGYSRPFLSERLKAAGLPSVGQLLTWMRLFHAGLWLAEPGRTAESVSRQLEYANGSTFRRALRSHVDSTPTQLVEAGGLEYVIDRFLQRYCLEDGRLRRQASVA